MAAACGSFRITFLTTDCVHESPRHDCFAELLGMHHARLLAFIRSLLVDPNDAHDVFQETAVALWQQFEQYDAERNFGAWARGIAYHKTIDFLRSRGRERARLSDELIAQLASLRAEQEETPELLLVRKAALSRCVEKLTERQRELLNRCYSGGETVRDVADSLHRTTHSIYASLRHIRVKLLDCIQLQVAQPGDDCGR